MESIWKEVKTTIKKLIPDHSFQMWIEPIEFEGKLDNEIFLTCPNFFSKKRVQDYYRTLIEDEVSKITGYLCKIKLNVTNNNLKVASKKKKQSSKKQINGNKDNVNGCQMSLPNMNLALQGGRHLRKNFTFDNFVVGKNNDFAYTASLSVASKKSSDNSSLFLLSDTGMGKSHLSQAIGHYIISEKPQEKVYYISAEDFSNEMVLSFKENTIEKFKDRYRTGCDVLLLEDVHFLSGKERTQLELAMILDYLFEADKKIIFSGCYLPSDIPKMSDQLVSRLSAGLISNIDLPAFNTRVRILQQKSKENGYHIPNDIIEYLAGELTDNVRQLESGLIGVATKSSLLGVAVDLDLAQSVVKNIIRQKKQITIDLIKKLVCEQYNIKISEIVSKSRKQNIVKPRQIAIYLSRNYTDQPLETIGKSFNRYHATAMHSINTIERGMKKDKALQKQVEYLSKKLEANKFSSSKLN